MKLVILNQESGAVEILNNIRNVMSEDIEKYLYERGYNTGKISWMEVNEEQNYVPVIVHDAENKTQQVRVKDTSIHHLVDECKRMEREKLIKAMRLHGTETDKGLEYSFKEEARPIIPAYDGDFVCDVVIYSVILDKHGFLSLMGNEKDVFDTPHEISADDVFAGHLSYVTDVVE